MGDVVHIKKTHIFWMSVLVVAFVASLVYAYVLLKEGQKKDNCWDNYTTEQEAILNCEGVNE